MIVIIIIINNTVPIAPDIIGTTLEPLALVLGLTIIVDDVTTDVLVVLIVNVPVAVSTDTINEYINYLYYYLPEVYVVCNNDVLVFVSLINVTNEYIMIGYSHNVHIPDDDGA